MILARYLLNLITLCDIKFGRPAIQILNARVFKQIITKQQKGHLFKGPNSEQKHLL